MVNYKKVAKYWRDSLVDALFCQGKYKEKNLEESFIKSSSSTPYRLNSKSELQKLFSVSDVDVKEVSYTPFYFKKSTSHTKYEKDYRPEILIPFTIKVQLSKYGFIYPIDNPIIPRDLLLPLDKDDFYLGLLDDYESFIARESVEFFEYATDEVWEVYFQEHFEKDYNSELIQYLISESLVTKDDEEQDILSLVTALFKNKVKNEKLSKALDLFNEKWDQKIQVKTQNDEFFKKAIDTYYSKWEKYIEYINKLWDQVVTSKDLLIGYERNDIGLFGEGELNAVEKIVAVYDDLYTTDKAQELGLFLNYTSLEPEEEVSLIDTEDFFTLRLGHYNDKYPLADAQRTAVSALLAARNGEILPVNGPPGTGKTTMLLSVVACLWVEHAIKGIEPPVIIVNSTNNQAVTNVIDAFAKDFSHGESVFAGRWINHLNSFGSYFVSRSREEEAKKKGYFTEDFIRSTESESFYKEVVTTYLKHSKVAFNKQNITINESVELLHKSLIEKKEMLCNIKKLYNLFHQLGNDIKSCFDIDYTDETKVNRQAEEFKEKENAITVFVEKWEKYIASESILWSLFSFLPFVKYKRNLRIKLFIKECGFEENLIIHNLSVDNINNELENQKNKVIVNQQKISNFKEVMVEFKNTLHLLDLNLDIKNDLLEIDKIADTKLRFDMFLLATHYWEGRWLLEIEDMINNDDLNKIEWSLKYIREKNWRRRMKLTPCAVMTSFMLPSYFSYSRKLQENVYKQDYLYDFIDLLIVDEAGQVSPEIAGAGFAMAKKALIIGDTLQIPPIYKLHKSIDIGNLHKLELISKKQSLQAIDSKYEELRLKGITANGGSVMKIAQNRSKYFPEKRLERGLYLYEHRRCYDSIIEYCNELCYKGVLKPMRGEIPNNALLPSMGYLNVEGKCENILGSKKNELEAKLIAGWIISNYDRLREEYNGKELKEIIAVVTPFREQSICIKKYLRKCKKEHLIKELNQITVGTVHSLQGAERGVILFSPTYSRHNKGGFIDNDKSMLNVAVSRAKDSFLVFGDMTLFNRLSHSPSGLLAKYLLSNENNELKYSHQYSKLFKRGDLVSKEFPGEILSNYDEHDVFLKKVLCEASNRVVIVSPWIIYTTLKSNGYEKLLANNSIQITLYTDEKFNTYVNNKLDNNKKELFQIAIEELKRIGVEVIVLNNIHSKIVIRDNDCLCVGSFNWFSAQRGGKYANMEHSIIYTGDNVREEIECILSSLKD